MNYREFEQSFASTASIFDGLDIYRALEGMYERLGIRPEHGSHSSDAVIMALKDKISVLHKENNMADGIDLTK